MDEEQEELSTHEASQKSGMSQRYLASLLRQHKLEGYYDSKRRRWMVNAAALERFLTVEDKTGERRVNYARRMREQAQQAVQEGQLAQAESLYKKALSLFDYFYAVTRAESGRTRNELGDLYCKQQRYTEAETIFLQVLNDHKDGYDMPLLYTTLTNICDLYIAQDRFAEARLYLEQKQMVGAECVHKVNKGIERARLLMDQRKYEEATHVLFREADLLKYDEILDFSTKSVLYMAYLSLFIVQDKQEDIRTILEQFHALLADVRAEMSDAELLYYFAEGFRVQGRYWEAKTFFHYVLKLFEQEEGKPLTQLRIGLVLICLGQIYHEQESYDEAEASYVRALSLIESQRGVTHPDVAMVLRHLVKLAVDQGNYGEAFPLAERAELIEKQSSPELEDRSPTSILYHDANRMLEQGELAEAEVLLRRVLTLDEQEQGAEHPLVVDDLTLLAHVLLKEGKLAEAEMFARCALEMGERQGESRAATSVIQLHILLCIARAQGKEQEAISIQQRMAASNARGPRLDDIDAIFAFHRTALHAVTQGRYAEAEALIERTLIAHEHVLGKEHRQVVLYLNQLAEIYCLQGKHEQAELLLLRVLALSKRAESEETVLAAISLYHLAQFCLAQGDTMRAGRLAERAYREAEQTVGLNHVVAGIVLTIKTHVLFFQEKEKEAEEIAQQVEAIFMRSQRVESLFQLCAEQALVQVYNDMARRKRVLAPTDGDMTECGKAEPLARRALCEAERLLVVEHPLLMFFMYSLGEVLASQKKYQEAEALYQRALMIAEQVLEPVHNFMLMLLRGLGYLYQEQKQYAFAELTFKRLLQICEQRGDQDELHMRLLYQQVALMCLMQDKREEGERYLERMWSGEKGETGASPAPAAKDALSFLQDAMMDQSRRVEI